MKKNLFYLFALICSMSLFTACSDDEDTDWKKIPNTEIAPGENAVFEVNGSSVTTGSVQLTANSGSEAVLTIKKVIPGYDEIAIDVELQKQTDGSYNFDGKKEVTTPPAMMSTKAAASTPAIFIVSVNGNVSQEGKVSVKVSSVLSENAQGGLTGSWNVMSKAIADEESGTMINAPLWFTWSAKDELKPNMATASYVVSVFGSAALCRYLNQVTFHEDGNITAKYWSGGIAIEDVLNGMDENYNYLPGHTDWLNSPKNNLAFWYVKENNIYIVPNIDAIMNQVAADGKVKSTDAGIGDITAILAKLSELGIDITPLLPSVMEWMKTGIPLKYSKTDNGLKVYVDKAMAAPFVEALLPALDVLQVEVDKIMADPTNENAFLMQMMFGMLGIENLSDIKTIWAENTDNFELNINFTK